MKKLPTFPYHRDPVASNSIRESNAPCECCGESNGILYSGVVYCRENVENLCPWCIENGKAADKYDAQFFDAYFCDENYDEVDIPEHYYRDVFSRTIGFATFNPIGWWVCCDRPAEYIKRNEPYEMVFECKVCHKQQGIEDLD